MRKKSFWIMKILALILVLCCGLGIFTACGSDEKLLSAKEAAQYEKYTMTLPQGETSALAYITATCKKVKEETQEDGLLAETYWPEQEVYGTLYSCRDIDSVSVLTTEENGQKNPVLHITYETFDEEEVRLTYGPDGKLLERVVYFPDTDTVVIYEADTGETRLQKHFRHSEG